MADALLVAAVHALTASMLGPRVRPLDVMRAFTSKWPGSAPTPPRWFLAYKARLFLDLLGVCARDHPVAGSASLFVEELIEGRAPTWSPENIDVWVTHDDSGVDSGGPWSTGIPSPKALPRRLLDRRSVTQSAIVVITGGRAIQGGRMTLCALDRVECRPHVQSGDKWIPTDGIPGVDVSWRICFGCRDAPQAVQIMWQRVSRVDVDCDCSRERDRVCTACAKRLTPFYIRPGLGSFDPQRPDWSFDLDVSAVTARLADQRIVLQRDAPRVPGRIHVRPHALCEHTGTHIRGRRNKIARLAGRIQRYMRRGLCNQVWVPMMVRIERYDPTIDGVTYVDTAPVSAQLFSRPPLVGALMYADSHGERGHYLLVATPQAESPIK